MNRVSMQISWWNKSTVSVSDWVGWEVNFPTPRTRYPQWKSTKHSLHRMVVGS